MKRLVDCLARWAREKPDNPAISDARVDWSYKDLHEQTMNAAEFLRGQGVRPGDRVMLIGENCAALAALILGAGRLDAWVVLENARRAALEVDGVRDHAQPRLVVYVVEQSEAAQAHTQRHEAAPAATPFGDLAVTLPDTGAAACRVHPEAADQVAVLIYTTGSTGVPKGVMLTHANLLHIGELMRTQRRLTPDDRVYGILPITHVMGLSSGLLGTLSAGGHIRMVARFSPESCLDALRTQGITILQGAPAMFARLVEAVAPERRLEGSLRFIAAGGAPLDSALKEHIERVFGLTLHNGYGLSEAAACCWTRLDAEDSDFSVGPPNPGMEVRILDAAGKPVDVGETGELWVRGPNVMKGYFRMPERTREVLRPDGWFNTEDLARMTPDGRVHFEGRGKDLIIRSGFNVSPLEVEAALNAHRGVQYCAVLGVPREGNEDIVAIVEPAPRQTVTEAGLREFLETRLSPYKRPGRIVFVDALPVAPNGKVLKKQLMEQFGEML